MARKLLAFVAVLILLAGVVPCAQADNVPKGIYYTINDGTNFPALCSSSAGWET
jgi:hypothetical protein